MRFVPILIALSLSMTVPFSLAGDAPTLPECSQTLIAGTPATDDECDVFAQRGNFYVDAPTGAWYACARETSATIIHGCAMPEPRSSAPDLHSTWWRRAMGLTLEQGVNGMANLCNEERCINPSGDANGATAVSGTGNANGNTAVSGTGDSQAKAIAVSGTGRSASASGIAASGTGPADTCRTANDGREVCDGIAVSGAGQAQGAFALSVLGDAHSCRNYDGISNCIAISATGNATAPCEANDNCVVISLLGDARATCLEGGTGKCFVLDLKDDAPETPEVDEISSLLP